MTCETINLIIILIFMQKRDPNSVTDFDLTGGFIEQLKEASGRYLNKGGDEIPLNFFLFLFKKFVFFRISHIDGCDHISTHLSFLIPAVITCVLQRVGFRQKGVP